MRVKSSEIHLIYLDTQKRWVDYKEKQYFPEPSEDFLERTEAKVKEILNKESQPKKRDFHFELMEAVDKMSLGRWTDEPADPDEN